MTERHTRIRTVTENNPESKEWTVCLYFCGWTGVIPSLRSITELVPQPKTWVCVDRRVGMGKDRHTVTRLVKWRDCSQGFRYFTPILSWVRCPNNTLNLFYLIHITDRVKNYLFTLDININFYLQHRVPKTYYLQNFTTKQMVKKT